MHESACSIIKRIGCQCRIHRWNIIARFGTSWFHVAHSLAVQKLETQVLASWYQKNYDPFEIR